jgi:alpha-1,2-mannosyltransferase
VIAEPPASARRDRPARQSLPRRRSLSFALKLGLFAEIPLLLAGYLLVHSVPTMADFRVFWDTGRAVLAGGGGDFPYPAPAALALAPFGLLPYTLAATIFGLLAIAAVPLALYVLGVRDWRCYGAAFLTGATLSVIIAGALSSILALGAALAWRYRHRVKLTAVVVAATVVAKIFLWPLMLWLLATRRAGAASLSAVVLVVAALAGWTVTGFGSLVHYPSALSHMASLEQGDGYSTIAVGLAFGLSVTAARVAALILTALLVLGIFAVARGEDGDRRSFSLAIVTALLSTPIVWSHYFVLLLVPIALARPRLSALWLVPIGFWMCSIRSGGDVRMIVIAVSLTAVISVVALRPPSGGRPVPWPSAPSLLSR